MSQALLPSATAVLPTGATIRQISAHETNLLIDEIFVRQVYPLGALRTGNAPVVVDLGSNIGVFVHYVKSVHPGARIVAVEPVPPIASILRDNLETFENVRVVECGVGPESTVTSITYYPGYSIMSGLKADRELDTHLLANCIRQDLAAKVANEAQLTERHVAAALGSKLQSSDSFECTVKTLPQLLLEESIDSIDFLKMDVEGVERDILHSLPSDFWPCVQNIAIEIHQYDDSFDLGAELRTLLEGQGFVTSIAHQTSDRVPRTAMLYGKRACCS